MMRGSRPIGDKLAMQVEQHAGKPSGWLDREHGEATDPGRAASSEALKKGAFKLNMTQMSRAMIRRYFSFAVVLGISICSALAQPPSKSGVDMGWVGLYNLTLVGWLENENQLNALCSHAKVDTDAWRQCRDEKMRPKELLLRLRSRPDEAAASEGAFIIRATPGQELRAYYQPALAGRQTVFVPDLFDADWGYGPYFHQTFLERRGTWFLLPAGPLPRPAWVNISDPQILLLRDLQGQVIKTPKGDLVVIDLERRGLRARLAQAADHSLCETQGTPPVTPGKEVLIPVEHLYSTTGHLQVDVKYKRGC